MCNRTAHARLAREIMRGLHTHAAASAPAAAAAAAASENVLCRHVGSRHTRPKYQYKHMHQQNNNIAVITHPLSSTRASHATHTNTTHNTTPTRLSSRLNNPDNTCGAAHGATAGDDNNVYV